MGWTWNILNTLDSKPLSNFNFVYLAILELNANVRLIFTKFQYIILFESISRLAVLCSEYDSNSELDPSLPLPNIAHIDDRSPMTAQKHSFVWRFLNYIGKSYFVYIWNSIILSTLALSNYTKVIKLSIR